MPHSDAIFTFLNQIPPFCNLPKEITEEIADASSIKKYAAKDLIFLEGEAGNLGYIVYSGRVAMIKSSLNGREMIVELLPAGEPFGVVVFVEQRAYPLTARAQSDTEVIAIPRTIITQLTGKHPSIFQDILKVVSTRLQSSHNVSRAIAHDRVEVRIAATLTAFISRMNSENEKTIAIGRQELADIVGTTIETASRVCKQFEKDGIVDLKTLGSVRIINANALLQISNELQ